MNTNKSRIHKILNFLFSIDGKESKSKRIYTIALTTALIVGVFGWHGYKYITYKKHKRTFYNEAFSATVIKEEDPYKGSVTFRLSNGLEVFFYDPAGEKLMVGDLIRKDTNSYYYLVYRKEYSGKYRFYKVYDFEKQE